MTTARSPGRPDAVGAFRLPGTTETRLAGRRAIEDYVERLNLASPIASRRLLARDSGEQHELCIGAVGGPHGSALGDMGLAECRMGFSLEMHTRDASARPGCTVIGLPITGSITTMIRGREIVVRAGQGLVVDPADVQWSRIAAGTHLVEFTVSSATMQRLAADWLPGVETGRPRFAPLVDEPLARRLLLMVSEVAAVARGGAGSAASAGPVARELVARWMDLIALMLLHEQPMTPDRSPSLHDAAGVLVSPAASVRRAVDFIRAHADSAIGVAEIAAAACVSARTLLRHFEAQLGQTPSTYLRRTRLEGARADLRARQELAIRDIAWKWGFQNASKFSQAYQRLFGEPPRATRRDLR